MAKSRSFIILLCIISSIVLGRSSAALPLCPRLDLAFVDSLRSQCPLWIDRSPPIEVTGDTLERELARSWGSGYHSILFYASWCSFSRDIQATFYALSSMFPQISHLAVEESSAMPSVFSRYDIHSFPSILIANQTASIRYTGHKDLKSLVHFYKETTGLDPVSDLAVDLPITPGNSRSLSPWNESLREVVTNEPYLTLSLLFICLKAIIQFAPDIVSCLRALWITFARHMNLGMFGELTQLLERVIHVINIRKLCNKLGLCNKAQNFQNGANNARVWASSLASVSLGQSSSRSAHQDS